MQHTARRNRLYFRFIDDEKGKTMLILLLSISFISSMTQLKNPTLDWDAGVYVESEGGEMDYDRLSRMVQGQWGSDQYGWLKKVIETAQEAADISSQEAQALLTLCRLRDDIFNKLKEWIVLLESEEDWKGMGRVMAELSKQNKITPAQHAELLSLADSHMPPPSLQPSQVMSAEYEQQAA